MSRTQRPRRTTSVSTGSGNGDEAALRRELAEAKERNLNAVDALIGAEAAAAQARQDIDDIFHRLDRRESELRQLKELLGFELETPMDVIESTIKGRQRRPNRRSSDRPDA